SAASSSPSPSPEPVSKKGKTKAKSKPGQPRNEGIDPDWAYKPPPGSVLVQPTEFDLEDGCELWLIRVPDDFKPRHLSSLKIQVPPSSSSSTRVGTLERKNGSYDVWNVGDKDNSDQPVVGEELNGLSCLLPQDGKLKLAPIARRLVLSAQAVSATPDASAPPATLLQNPPRFSHPKHLLKHCFQPIGALSAPHEESDDVEMQVVEEEPTPAPSSKKESKKRKGE
ncbi:hypothetical protein C8J56DRAFT_753191, partial [Mycena floridula]